MPQAAKSIVRRIVLCRYTWLPPALVACFSTLGACNTFACERIRKRIPCAADGEERAVRHHAACIQVTACGPSAPLLSNSRWRRTFPRLRPPCLLNLRYPGTLMKVATLLQHPSPLTPQCKLSCRLIAAHGVTRVACTLLPTPSFAWPSL